MELSLKLAGETKLFLIFEQKDFGKKILRLLSRRHTADQDVFKLFVRLKPIYKNFRFIIKRKL